MKPSTYSTDRGRIDQARAQLLTEYVNFLLGLDESDPVRWPEIIKTVRDAGLERELLCRELSCAWSTILRWEAGQTLPGPFARKGIKAKLVELLQNQAGERRSIAAE